MTCLHCGHSSALEVNYCSSCGVALQRSANLNLSRLVRPRSPRTIAGVCSGIALFYGWDVTLVRILFALFTCFTTGVGMLVYVAAWLLLPEAQYALPSGSRTGSSASSPASFI